MQKILKYLFNTKAYVLYAVAVLATLAYCAIKGMSYLHFIDGLSVIGIIYLIIAVYSWAKAEKLVHFSLKKFMTGTTAVHKEDIDSVKEHYQDTNKKTGPNEFIGPGILITLIAVILTMFY